MNQTERRIFLIEYLMDEAGAEAEIPVGEDGQRRLLRALMNVRPPKSAGAEFMRVQDEYLAERAREKGVVSIGDTEKMSENIYLWRGDITRLAVGAIVNAANGGMTGCYVPNHSCIDNCIHTFAGVGLRLECARLMSGLGRDEPPGGARLTGGYNLPCGSVIHTVGPAITGEVSARDERLLASCYRASLELTEENGIESVAFCCVSTGVFRFPNRLAAEIAVKTVDERLRERKSDIRVIFNVFTDGDYKIYRELLGGNGAARA